ncbi:MAG: hypothetical protein SGARI_006810 [Bacillariaceae sp.]
MSSKFKRQSVCESGRNSLCGGNGRMYYSCARVKIEGTTSDLPPVVNDFYGEQDPVNYEWPLVEDWCRDDDEDEHGEEVPWRLCEETPQADFSSMNDIDNEMTPEGD